jgi:hypothetical protein
MCIINCLLTWALDVVFSFEIHANSKKKKMVLISSLLPTRIYLEYQYNYKTYTTLKSTHKCSSTHTYCRQNNYSPTKTALRSQPSRCRRSNSSNTRIHSNTRQFSGTYNFYVLPRLSRGLPIDDPWVMSTACDCGTVIVNMLVLRGV